MAPSFEARSCTWRIRFKTRSGRNISLSFQDFSEAANFEGNVTASPPDCDDDRLSTRSKRQKVTAAPKQKLAEAASCASKSYSVQTSHVDLYYRVPVCTTEYQFVLQSTSLYYRVPFCTTEHQFVLQSTSLYYTAPVCTTEYQFVLHSTSLY